MMMFLLNALLVTLHDQKWSLQVMAASQEAQARSQEALLSKIASMEKSMSSFSPPTPSPNEAALLQRIQELESQVKQGNEANKPTKADSKKPLTGPDRRDSVSGHPSDDDAHPDDCGSDFESEMSEDEEHMTTPGGKTVSLMIFDDIKYLNVVKLFWCFFVTLIDASNMIFNHLPNPDPILCNIHSTHQHAQFH